MFHRAVLFVLLCAGFSGYCAAQFNGMSLQGPQTQMDRHSSRDFNSLSGTVTGADNRPLQDVRIELHDGSTGSVIGAAYTNSGGSFEFDRLSPGTYQVVASLGLAQADERVDVTTANAMVNMRLGVSSKPEDGNGANAVSVAQYKVPGKARDELKKAREAAEKGKNEDAQRHLAKSLEIFPKYADALTFRAILKLDDHNVDSALTDLQQAISDDGNYPMAYVVMGAALNMQSKFDEAIRNLQRSESLAPNNWQAYFEMGKAYVGKADYPSALRQLNRAQLLAPSNYALIHLIKGHALLALNQYDDAMAELQAFLQKEPNGANSAQAQKMLQQAKAFARR